MNIYVIKNQKLVQLSLVSCPRYQDMFMKARQDLETHNTKTSLTNTRKMSQLHNRYTIVSEVMYGRGRT